MLVWYGSESLQPPHSVNATACPCCCAYATSGSILAGQFAYRGDAGSAHPDDDALYRWKSQTILGQAGSGRPPDAIVSNALPLSCTKINACGLYVRIAAINWF